MKTLSQQEAEQLLGKPPAQAAKELRCYSRAAQSLAAQLGALLSEHPQQWVALYDGKAKVFGESLDAVMAKVDAKGFPREQVVVRFLDENAPLQQF